MLNHVRQRAAFARLEALDLDAAKELFVKGRVDPRELISLFPGLLSASAGFVRAVPALHDLPDISGIAKGDAEKLRTLKLFLGDLLYYMRIAEGEEFAYKKDVDGAILKLYADGDTAPSPSALASYVSELGGDLRADLDECRPVLESSGRHYALASAFFQRGKPEVGLAVLAKLVKGEVRDEDFETIEEAERIRIFVRKLKR